MYAQQDFGTMNSTSDVRSRITLKLRALLAKTVENGATEHEAMAAAEKASELMEEYDLSYADIEQVRDERYGARTRPFGGGTSRRRTHHEASQTHNAIAAFCDCRAWYSGIEMTFFGTVHDTETAHAMADMIRLTMDQEFAGYLNSRQREQGVHGRTLRASFMMGMAHRISTRLRAMKHERDKRADTTAAATGRADAAGRSLVVVAKSEIVKEKANLYFKEKGWKMGSARSGSRSLGSRAAYHAGAAAGDRVGLNPALGGSHKRIGR